MKTILVFLITTAVKVSSLHFPQSVILHRKISERETLYFNNVLFTGSEFRLSVDYPGCDEDKSPSLLLRWKIEGSTCFQRFGILSFNPLSEEKLIQVGDVAGSVIGISNHNATVDGEELSCEESYHLGKQTIWKKYDIFGEPLENGDKIVSNQPAETDKQKPNDVVAVAPFDGYYLLSLSVSRQQQGKQIGVVIDVKGPQGYLSKIEVPVFYGHFIVLGFWLGFLLVFLLPYVIKYRNKPNIHLLLAVLVAIEVLTSLLCSINYSQVNNYGTSHAGLNVISILIGCLSDTLLRITLLLLCAGLGEILQYHSIKVKNSMLLGVFYFVFNLTHELVCLEGNQPLVVEMMLILACICEAVIFFHVCKYVLQTSEILKNVVVYTSDGMFSRFSILLKIFSVASFLLITAVIWNSYTTFCSLGWFLTWFRVSFWLGLRFVFVVAVAVIYKRRNRGDSASSGLLLQTSSFFRKT